MKRSEVTRGDGKSYHVTDRMFREQKSMVEEDEVRTVENIVREAVKLKGRVQIRG